MPWKRAVFHWMINKKRRKQGIIPSLRRFSNPTCDRIRTRDLLVRSQTLYPAELRTYETVSSAIIGWRKRICPIRLVRVFCEN